MPTLELEELLEPYRIAFEASPVGMAFVSPDWEFVECNPALCEMLGRSEEELRGRSATDFTHPDDVHLHEPNQQRLLAGEIDQYQLQARYLHTKGRVGWVNVHVGVLRAPSRAIKLVIALVEDITEQRRMREIHDRLLGLVLVGQGGRALASALAEQIQSPVALLDGYGQVLAEGEHDGQRVRIPARDELQAEPNAASPALTVRPLHLGERVEGYLVAEDPQGASHLTAMAIEQAASSFALQLAMTRNAEEVEHRLHGDLFDAMLSDNPPDTPSLVRWAERLGHDLFSYRLVACARSADAASDSIALTRLARSAGAVAEESAPGSVAVPRGDAVLIALAIQAIEPGRAIAERLVQHVELLAGTRIVVGLSGEVTGPADLGDALRDARLAADAAAVRPRLGPVAAYGDLDLQHLLLGRKTPDEIARAARRTLGPLIEDPRLIATLAAYLESVGSLETTSRRLGVHVNTLRQRLLRIEEALEVDLRDSGSRVNLQLALEVLALVS